LFKGTRTHAWKFHWLLFWILYIFVVTFA
jgi:hypothetical protein